MNIARAIVEHAIFHGTSGIGGTGLIYIGAYADYATLSSSAPAALNLDKLAYVNTTTGIIGINRKVKGYYKSDGSSWVVYETDQQAFDALTQHETTYAHATFITAADLDLAIEANAVVNKYRRGYNQTGVTLPAFSVAQPTGSFFSNYPKITGCDLTISALGILTAALPTNTGAKILYDGVLPLGPGILDSTVEPLLSPVYADAAGGLTFSYTTILVGYTLTQSLTPVIYVQLQFIRDYLEIPFTSLTSQVFNHDFKRYSNIIVLDAVGNDITSSVLLNHDPGKNSVSITTNVPITGKIVCSGN